jgi:phosphodiesterase/alkaline phosphatase D-like protein
MSVQKPSILSPVNNTQDNLFVLNAVSSAFEQQGNLSHISSTWELATNSSFSSIVTRLSKDTINKTSWTVPGLLTNTDYYVRVKYHSEFDLESSWSNSVTFRTKAASVNTPTITSPPNDGLLYYGDNIISTSSFSSVGELSHSNTEWEIATDVNFTNIVASTNATNTDDKHTWLVKTIV